MKGYLKALLPLLLLLILLDQGAKLLIEQTVPFDDSLMRVSNTFHLHPAINDENMTSLSAKALESGNPLWLYVAGNIAFKLFGAVFACAVMYPLLSFCACLIGGKFRRGLFLLQATLLIASSVCNCICMLLRGGSLDYLCIAKDIQIAYRDHFHAVPSHRIFDIKDLYVWLGMALVILLVVMLLVDAVKYTSRYYALPKTDRKEETLAMKERAKAWCRQILEKKEKRNTTICTATETDNKK